MPSLRAQIMAQAVVALTGATDAGAHVYRSREVSIARELTPAIVVMPDGEQSQRMGDGVDRHEFLVVLAIFTRVDPWDAVADVVAEQAHRVVMADPTLLAMAIDIRKVSTDYEAEEADRTAGTLSARYRFTYLSRAGDIAAAP